MKDESEDKEEGNGFDDLELDIDNISDEMENMLQM